MVPYRTPIISYPVRYDNALLPPVPDPVFIRIDVSGDAESMFTSDRPVEVRPSDLQGRPLFPYLALVIEEQLLAAGVGDNASNWRCRWVFDDISLWDSSYEITGKRANEPKLAILSVADGNPSDGSLIVYGVGEFQVLFPEFGGLVDSPDRNYIGARTSSGTGAYFEIDFPVAAEIAAIADFGPAGCFNPMTLQFGDIRDTSTTTGQSVSVYSQRKFNTIWAQGRNRTLTFPLVHASNLHLYRRMDPLFEPDEIRRRSSNNTYEGLVRSMTSDIDYYIWATVPDPNTLDSVEYFAGFRGRKARYLSSRVVGDGSEGYSYQEQDLRLGNIDLQFFEPNVPPDTFNLGGKTITIGTGI